MPDAPLSRREFLRVSALLSLGLGLGPVLAPLPVQAAAPERLRLERTRFLMGTFVTMIAAHPSRAQAEDALEAAFAEMDRLCAVFDRHRADTPLTFLNRHGSLRDAPPELSAVLVHALRMRDTTSGAFDPSVLPLVALLQSRSQRAPEGPAPSLAEIREALSLVDAGAVDLTSSSIRLGRQGMGLTLDGVAKGYIVDRAAQVLRERGLDSHLINAGGDIRAGLAPDAERPWAVAVEDPQRRGRYPSRIFLRNGAVATSGSYEAPLGAHGRLHHIVDPRSGGCPGHVTSVSVAAPSAMEADALATGLFVLPPGQALACIETLPERACLLISSSGAQARSQGWSGLEAAGPR